MSKQVLAAVRTGVHKTEFREYPMPEISEDSALLKMEVAGICGTDVKFYAKPPIIGSRYSASGPSRPRSSGPA